MPILETERLSLRELGAGDEGFILELLNDPAFIRYIADPGVRTLEDAHHYIENGPRQSYERHGFGLWLAERKTDGAPIGICGLLKRDVLDSVDIGYALLPGHRSQGYAREAAAGCIRHAFDTLSLPRVAAVVNEDNTASIRLLEGLGMRYERMIRLSPEDVEICLYVLDRTTQEQH